ncbi:hypothetical protein, partial [Desulfobotulus mexicanus]
MAESEILADLGGGRYRVRLLRNWQHMDQQMQMLTETLEQIQPEASLLEEELAGLEAEQKALSDKLDAAIISYRQAMAADPSSASMAGIQKVMQEKNQLTVGIRSRRLKLQRLHARILTLEIRRQTLQDLKNDRMQDIREVWCADCTQGLSGTVATLEVNGEPEQVLLAPGTRPTPPDFPEGYLMPAMAMTTAQAVLNWTLFPGWQKWKPTVRTGILLERNLDTHKGRVRLDDARSHIGGMGINGLELLEEVPIEYMSCGASAFEEGDSVLVAFREQDPEKPVVIGFVEEPRPCVTTIILRVVFHRCALYWDVVNDDFADIPWQAPEGWQTGDPWPEGWPEGLNYGPPSKWQTGEPWPYTRHLKRILQYDDDGQRLHFEMEQGHKHFIRNGEVGQAFTKENRHQRHHPRRSFSEYRSDYNNPGFDGDILDYLNAGSLMSWKDWSCSKSTFRCALIFRYYRTNMDYGDMEFLVPIGWNLTNTDINFVFESTELHPGPIILRDARYDFNGAAYWVLWDDMSDPLPGCPPGGAHTYVIDQDTFFEIREAFYEHNGEIQWSGGSEPFGIYWKARRNLQRRYELESGYFNVTNKIYSYRFSCQAVTLQDLKVKSLTNLRFPSGRHPVWDAAWTMDSSRLWHTAVVLEHLRAVSPPPDKDEEYLQFRDYGHDGGYRMSPTRSIGNVHRGGEWGPASIGFKTAYPRIRSCLLYNLR